MAEFVIERLKTKRTEPAEERRGGKGAGEAPKGAAPYLLQVRRDQQVAAHERHHAQRRAHVVAHQRRHFLGVRRQDHRPSRVVPRRRHRPQRRRLQQRDRLLVVLVHVVTVPVAVKVGAPLAMEPKCAEPSHSCMRN